MKFTNDQIKELGDLFINELKTVINDEAIVEDKIYIRDDVLQLLLQYLLKNYNDYLKYIDLSEVSFSNIDVTNVDFRFTNANIDPQKVHDKNLYGTNLDGIIMIQKSFEGVFVENANLNNTHSIIDVSLLKYKSICGTKLKTCSLYNVNSHTLMNDETDLDSADLVYEEGYSDIEKYIRGLFK